MAYLAHGCKTIVLNEQEPLFVAAGPLPQKWRAQLEPSDRESNSKLAGDKFGHQPAENTKSTLFQVIQKCTYLFLWIPFQKTTIGLDTTRR